jgi:hypothetical protein
LTKTRIDKSARTNKRPTTIKVTLDLLQEYLLSQKRKKLEIEKKLIEPEAEEI